MSLLGIDIGQSGAKGCVFNLDGKILAYEYVEYSMLYSKPGFAEIDSLEMSEKIKNLIKKLNSKIKKDPIETVSVSTFGESLVPINREGRILSNIICPNDIRGKSELEKVIEKIGDLNIYKITSLKPSYTYSLNKVLWYKKSRPDIYKNTYKFLFIEDMFYKLLGIENTSVSYSLSGRTMFFDINKKSWSKQILEKLDIDPNKFSVPIQSGSIIGRVSNNVKEELDFKNDVDVVVGGHDQSCAGLGSGSVKEGVAANSMGTVECITPVFDKIKLNNYMYKNSFCCGPHVLKDLYVTVAYNMTAGSIINWYKNSIGFKDYYNSQKISKDFYDYIYEGIDFKPSDILVLPYFGPSATPYFYEKPLGSMMGMATNTTIKDIFKAIIESLVFEIKLNIELLKDCGIEIDQLRAIGKGSKSDYWLQLKANILNKKVLRMKVNEAGCVGTAILAAVAKSIFKDYQEAVDNFVKVDKEFYPREQNLEFYLKKYQKYKKLFNLVRSII